MQRVPLNAFQQIMRMWDQVHPYNAAHAFRLEGDADIQRITEAWQTTLRSMGIGWISVKGDYFAHVPAQAPVYVAPPGATLDQVVSDEMNVRMNAEEGSPFRLFIVPESGAHCIGITYHHWVADSASIRWLLHEFFLRLQNLKTEPTPQARIPVEGHWHFFGPDAAHWPLLEGVMDVLRNRTRYCRMRQIGTEVDDSKVAVTFHHLPHGVAPKLASLARANRATFNDLILSSLAQVMDELGVTPSTKHRDEMAIGTIVDLRASASKKMDDVFGLFLGFTTTMVRPADLKDWQRLLRTVSKQNAHQKRTKSAHASILRMAAALIEARFVTPKRWGELYRKRMPMVAGISNVNMNRTWAGEHHPSPILDYYRIAPTGPILPAAFTPTTLGNRMNFGITRLACLIDPQKNAAISQSLSDRLIQLTSNVR